MPTTQACETIGIGTIITGLLGLVCWYEREKDTRGLIRFWTHKQERPSRTHTHTHTHTHTLPEHTRNNSIRRPALEHVRLTSNWRWPGLGLHSGSLECPS